MVPDPTATSASTELVMRPCFEHHRHDRAQAGKRAFDTSTQHFARHGIADDGKPASEPKRRHNIRLHAGKTARDVHNLDRHPDRLASIRIGIFAPQQLVERVGCGRGLLHCAVFGAGGDIRHAAILGALSQASRMSSIWPRNDPLAGENAPSKTADPIVKASAPASASA